MKTNNAVLALAAASAAVANPMVTVKVTSTITICDSSTSVGAAGTETAEITTGTASNVMSSLTLPASHPGVSSVAPGEIGSGMTQTFVENWSTFTPVVTSSVVIPGVGLNGTALLSSSADAVSGGSSDATTTDSTTLPTGGASTTSQAAASSTGTGPAPTSDAGNVQMQGSMLGLVVFCAIGLFLF